MLVRSEAIRFCIVGIGCTPSSNGAKKRQFQHYQGTLCVGPSVTVHLPVVSDDGIRFPLVQRVSRLTLIRLNARLVGLICIFSYVSPSSQQYLPYRYGTYLGSPPHTVSPFIPTLSPESTTPNQARRKEWYLPSSLFPREKCIVRLASTSWGESHRVLSAETGSSDALT